VHQLCRTQGTAVLWATHLLEEAEGADHLLLLSKGDVRYSGTVNDFVQAQGGGDFAQAAMRVLGVG
jgi:ABC-2 type transport system ATP-binding protein